MSSKRSLKSAAKRAASVDANARKPLSKAAKAFASDSFQNFEALLGIGANNMMSGSTYGFNPISRNHTLLEWIYRGAWLGGVSVDVAADDMTRAGIKHKGEINPKDADKMDAAAVRHSIWPSINKCVKWARLYGGAIAVLMIDGQNPATPLRVDAVGRGQFKGLMVLDRWQVQPSLQEIITDLGPNLGLPKFYSVIADAQGMPSMRIHHSRCLRLEGTELPYWQKLQENMWGVSIYERLYDRMVAFDSATTGAAQLVYKAYLRTIKINGLREIAAAGGPPADGLARYVDMMRRYQGIEGMTMIDGEDDIIEGGSGSSFAGIGETLGALKEQICGALQIPATRLFGNSPGGLNSTGEGDMRNYYDGIKQTQETDLHNPLVRINRVMALSEGIKLPDDYDIEFRSLWQLDDQQKATVAKTTTDAVCEALEAGIISKQTSLKELHQSSGTTGIFTNITAEDIDSADDTPPEPELPAPKISTGETGGASKPASGASRGKNPSDAAMSATNAMDWHHGIHVVIENPKGDIRRGGIPPNDWAVPMPDDYGYLRSVTGADGDQLDCYVGADHTSEKVFVIDQLDLEDGGFDEHKCMLGYPSRAAAVSTYVSGYHDGAGVDRLGAVTEMSMAAFRDWLDSGDTQSALALDRGWEEFKHPRVITGARSGQFTRAASASLATATAQRGKYDSGIKLAPKKSRTYNGAQINTKTFLTATEIGELGERICAAWLQSNGYRDSRPFNAAKKNEPVDLICPSKLTLIEVKTSQVAVKQLRWRVKFDGKYTDEEKAYFKENPGAKTEYNAQRLKACMSRKAALLRAYNAAHKDKASAKSMCVVVNADTKSADIYMVDGFHKEVGFRAKETQNGYVGTFNYTE